jgi:predicted chitinase
MVVITLTGDALASVMPRLPRDDTDRGTKKKASKAPFTAAELAPVLSLEMFNAGISTHPGVACAFLAQIGHESMDLTAWEERKNDFMQAYEPLDGTMEGLIYDRLIKGRADDLEAKARAAAKDAGKPAMINRAKLDAQAWRDCARDKTIGAADRVNCRRWVNTGQRGGLGNTDAGDGERFKGRGPMQVTGRDNYRRLGKKLGVDLEAEPEKLATDMSLGIRSAVEFWQSRRLTNVAKDLRGVVEAADDPKGEVLQAERSRFDLITKAINAGMLHKGERWDAYVRCVRELWPRTTMP